MFESLLGLLLGTPAPDAALAKALEADVRTLVSEHAPRDFDHPENLRLVARWLGKRFEAAGASALTDQIYDADGREYRNVIATFGPATAAKVIVGAHYDTAGPLPGADDNASGVAVLLALAERLGKSPPAMRVELVAWTLEEPPHFATKTMGSRVHARALAADKADVRAIVALEMLGYYSDARGSQTYPDPALAARYGDKGDFLAIVGRPEDMPILTKFAANFERSAAERGLGSDASRQASGRSSRAAPRIEVLAAPAELTGVAFSDHSSYWPHGFTAVMLTDTAFYRNQNYHTRADTPDTLDYQRMAQAVAGVERAVRALAGGTPND